MIRTGIASLVNNPRDHDSRGLFRNLNVLITDNVNQGVSLSSAARALKAGRELTMICLSMQ